MLAIMLTGIVQRCCYAQASEQAGQSSRAAMPLEPPPRPQVEAKSDLQPTQASQPSSARSLRIIIEMAPPTKKPATVKPNAAHADASKPSVTDLGAPKPPAKIAVDLEAPRRTTPAA